MICLEGEHKIKQSKDIVWLKLTDTSLMSGCIPGLEHIDYLNDHSVKARAKLSVSFIKGSMTTLVRLHDLTAYSSVNMTAHSEGIGSTVDLELHIDLSESNGVTSLTWKAETRIGGLLGRVSEGLLTKAANQLVTDTLECVGNQIEATPPT